MHDEGARRGGARLPRRTRAADELRAVSEAASPREELIDAAIEHAEESGVDGHTIWMARTVLSRLREERRRGRGRPPS